MFHYSLLQYFAVSCLWVSKIKQLIQEFIDNNKIVSYTFFFKFLKIFNHYLKIKISLYDIEVSVHIEK